MKARIATLRLVLGLLINAGGLAALVDLVVSTWLR
jgi:hypothetical protein